MICKLATGCLILTGLYSDAQLYGAKHALADTGQRRVADYLQDGWSIQAAAAYPHPSLILQKSGEAVWCVLRDDQLITIKGVPQILTASCTTIR
jgi:hypothetical protein